MVHCCCKVPVALEQEVSLSRVQREGGNGNRKGERKGEEKEKEGERKIEREKGRKKDTYRKRLIVESKINREIVKGN